VEGTPALARLRVRDRGLGIPPEDQVRIFERFERAVPTRHYGGFGLGLWISRQLVEAMGGNIQVDSTPGQGSTFTVELPLQRPQDEDIVHEAQGAARWPRATRTGVRVAVVRLGPPRARRDFSKAGVAPPERKCPSVGLGDASARKVSAFAPIILGEVMPGAAMEDGMLSGIARRVSRARTRHSGRPPVLLVYGGKLLEESIRAAGLTDAEVMHGLQRLGVDAKEQHAALVLEEGGAMRVFLAQARPSAPSLTAERMMN
jgi:hypothetical protein